MPEPKERTDVSHEKDYDIPDPNAVLNNIRDSSEVKHPERKPDVERRNQRDSDHGNAPEIKGEGGARGQSGGSSQPGNQENVNHDRGKK